tara:strand:- start:1234 stop:1707 length:474 start_codon:yes stop_codon:yes gene_type:complete
MYYTVYQSKHCPIILVGDEKGLSRIFLETGEGTQNVKIEPEWTVNDNFFTEEIKQLEEYLQGNRTQFNLRLNPAGTDYQKQVWRILAKIPYGKVYSYKDVAELTGNPKASRAVGMANSKNPLPIVVPCHRVIGANGKLTGYACGLKIKKELLKLEGI